MTPPYSTSHPSGPQLQLLESNYKCVSIWIRKVLPEGSILATSAATQTLLATGVSEVTLPGSTPTLKKWAGCTSETMNIAVEMVRRETCNNEMVDLPGSATSLKREHPEDPFEANKHIRHEFATLPMQTPSMIAMPCYFQEHYQKKHEPRICCGRPDENHSPFPLVLAHRIFATFVSECETYEPRDEDLKFILKLSRCMYQVFGDEKDWRTQLRACMKEYGISLMESKIEGTEYMTDGDARLIYEAKKDVCASKEDPYIQAAAYHLAAMQ
ncbi:hypothetical protein J3R82DRAFT_4618 [Butyriboletus roseoflavus]|nr:hypothetical protein J3R82DRAFT_4618 [Butyriboletus roseoflavus]